MADVMPEPIFHHIEDSVSERHLQQLENLDLVAEPKLPYNLPIGVPGDSSTSDYQRLLDWTSASSKEISAAVQNRVWGGGRDAKAPNFDNAFLAFMESAAMYLRDTKKVVKAVDLYKSGDKEGARKLLHESTKLIEDLAAKWDMDFLMICDLVDKPADGQSWVVGPFCGAFVPRTSGKPFIGIAFKGTSTPLEWANNLLSMKTLVPPSDHVFAAEVASGFYYPLFSTYEGKEKSSPIELIQKAIRQTADSRTDGAESIVHVTGHSLGAAYGSLTYGQLLYKGFETKNAKLGDLYAYGSPRVGRREFAKSLKSHVSSPTSNGCTWRFSTSWDPVSMVPKSFGKTESPYTHIDALYYIGKDEKPKPGGTEFSKYSLTINFGIIDWLLKLLRAQIKKFIDYHLTPTYYASLKYATATGFAVENSDVILETTNVPQGLQGDERLDLDGDSLMQSIVSALLSHGSSSKGTLIAGSTDESRFVGLVRVGTMLGEVKGVSSVGALNLTEPVELTVNAESIQSLYGTGGESRIVIRPNAANATDMEVHFFGDGNNIPIESGLLHLGSNETNRTMILEGNVTWLVPDTELIERVNQELVQSLDSSSEENLRPMISMTSHD